MIFVRPSTFFFHFDLGVDIFVVLQELAGILSALSDTLTLVTEPGALASVKWLTTAIKDRTAWSL